MSVSRRWLALVVVCATSPSALAAVGVSCTIDSVNYGMGAQETVCERNEDDGISIPGDAVDKNPFVRGSFGPFNTALSTVQGHIVEYDPSTGQETNRVDLSITRETNAGGQETGRWKASITVKRGKTYIIRASTTYQGRVATDEVLLNVGN